jgi:hypothetical protein
MPDRLDNIERLLVDCKESLERDIQGLRELITTRFDTQAARLDRQDALIQTLIASRPVNFGYEQRPE